LDGLVQKLLGRRKTALQPTAYELTIFFGQCDVKALQPLARQIFETFRSPILKVELRLQGTWRIGAIKTLALGGLTPEQETGFFGALDWYLSQRWRQPRARLTYKYDLAILHDPAEELPPSDKEALKQFVRAGKALGVNCELIQRKDYSRLAEYDALFIRETTSVNHYTYRLARRAAAEGLVVIDDPLSILRCSNKVYLAELLEHHKIPAPKTLIVHRDNVETVIQGLGLPVILKQPDSTYSQGVIKVETEADYADQVERLLDRSELVIAQEYVPTEFDWRVGVLDHRPLYVCKYFMVGRHWQIIKKASTGRFLEGRWETLPVELAPKKLLRTALRAADLVGDGLYGVDLKEIDGNYTVIEVNDNPTIEAGVEDDILKDDLYVRIMEVFLKRIERLKEGAFRP
jgi:glutathione synthase/RimK-type ligase-like ATP-grasp enzyme